MTMPRPRMSRASAARSCAGAICGGAAQRARGSHDKISAIARRQRITTTVSEYPTVNQPQPERIVIATRESRLALWQAEHVRDRLRALYPHCSVELLGMTTRGDQILDRPLAKVGGKGLFVKELETALLDRRADLAVHSMKDVPMQLAPEFALVATGDAGRSITYSRSDSMVRSSTARSSCSPPPSGVTSIRVGT